MSQYNVILKKFGQEEKHGNFLSMSEVKVFLNNLGFEFVHEIGRWEQTYETVDPFSQEADDCWVLAEIEEESGVAVAG